MSAWEAGKAQGIPTVPLSNGLNIPVLGLGKCSRAGLEGATRRDLLLFLARLTEAAGRAN